MREAPCYGFYATSLMKKRNLFHPCQNRWFLATHCSPPYWSGGETRSLSILRPTTIVLRACEPLLSSVRRRAPRRGSLGPAPIAAGFGTPATTSEPLIPAHLDPERNRRWAEHCRSVKQKGAKACFMVPRWSASAHLCRGTCSSRVQR